MRQLLVPVIVVGLLVGSGQASVAQDGPESRPPIPSAGCGTSTVEPGSQYGSMEVDGSSREWLTWVPATHDGSTPVPLWLQLHGASGRMTQYTSYLRPADHDFGFVIVSPQGVREQVQFGRAWMWSGEQTELDLSDDNPDIAFIDALLDRVSEEMCIDLARVYAAGYSSGGLASSVLACVMDDRFAAVAPVATYFAELGAACDTGRPMPHVAIIGTLDPFYAGCDPETCPWLDWAAHPISQAIVPDDFIGGATAIAMRNGCEPAPTSESIGEGIEKLTWTCPVGAEVEVVTIEGAFHNWPPRGKVDAPQLIWDFFEQHPMPE